MKILNIIFFNLIISSGVLAASPEPGKFNWANFVGNYKYVNCEIKNNKPIWADDPENTKVEIYRNFSQDENNLQLIRWHENSSYVLLGTSIDKIDLGQYVEYDEETQKIYRTVLSYATNAGVYSVLNWNFKDINVGWSKIELISIDANTISYMMEMQRVEDIDSVKETCILKKIKP